MALRITVDIFSGRENPVLVLEGGEAQEALERLRPVRRIERGERGLPPEPTLGYRGLIVEQLGKPVRTLPRTFRFAHGDLFGPGLAHRAADEAFEDFVCGTGGPIRRVGPGPRFPLIIKREIDRFRRVRLKWPWDRRIVWPIRNPCACAPLYEPGWWNVPARQPYNNCYNYATNYRTDTFAQPGKAAGAMYSALTCASDLLAAATASLEDELATAERENNPGTSARRMELLGVIIDREFGRGRDAS